MTLFQRLCASMICSTVLFAQSIQPAGPTTTAVPRLVRIDSLFRPADGADASASESVTLRIYAEETGGTPLWQETQNVAVDRAGHYSLLLGVTRNEGLPTEVFASGQPRWLGVQFARAGEVEQPRTLLASVPYALKAADAETLGGLPAAAYLLNPLANTSASTTAGVAKPATALPRLSSTGTAGSIAMFTDNSGDLGNSVLFQSGNKVGLGTTHPLDYFHVAFTDTTGGFTGYAVQNLGSGANSYSGMLFYDQTGTLGQFQGFNNSTHEYRINNIAQTSGTVDGSINFMIGGKSAFKVRSDLDVDIPNNIRRNGTLFVNTIGTQNTSVGLNALAGTNNTFNGNYNNTALGYNAGSSNINGANNTAVGSQALFKNVNGNQHTAVGSNALYNYSGSSGTVLPGNTGIGFEALYGVTTGFNNTALGAGAGQNVTSGGNNIMIANAGTSGDDSIIRIGAQGTQTNTYIAGISGVSVANSVAVYIDTNGHLGTVQSSRRYKEDIQDMNEASENLYRLRPVTYRYKQPYPDGSMPLDYGLIAEEVALIYPDLVVRNNDGTIETVQYQKLTPMLLNELQREHQAIQTLEEKLARLQDLIDGLAPGSATLGAKP